MGSSNLRYSKNIIRFGIICTILLMGVIWFCFSSHQQMVHVVDEKGVPVEGARVISQTPSFGSAPVYTDRDGNAPIPQIGFLDQKMIAIHASKENDSGDASLPAKSPVTIVIKKWKWPEPHTSKPWDGLN